MNPVVALTLGIVGAAALIRWGVREMRRITTELDGIRNQPARGPVDPHALPKLKRDPVTGEYRPG
jgi:hypothetical protein